MLTDRRQGCLVKSFALALLSLQIFLCSLGYVPYIGTYSDAMEIFLRQFDLQFNETSPVIVSPTSTSGSPIIVPDVSRNKHKYCLYPCLDRISI